MTQIYSQMTGWGAYTPEKVLTNFELTTMVDTTDEWIVQRSGIRERRIAAAHETTSTMAVNASLAALTKANLRATDLDLIIVATSTPDHHTPPVSSQIQHALGAADVPAFVLVTGCTGFVYALVTAHQFIATGVYRTILVIGAELLSRFTDWTDRSTCVLFGDAAGAVILQATDAPCGVRGFALGSDGSLGKHILLPAGGSALPPTAEALENGGHFIQMNGREVFKFATRVIGRACDDALKMAGYALDDVDWIIPHQANLRIIQAAARNMNVPLERFVVNIEKYGNTSAASIPLALVEKLESGCIQPAQTLLLASFGAGLTWATAVLQMAPSY